MARRWKSGYSVPGLNLSFTVWVLGIQVRKQGLEVSTFAYRALPLNSAPTSRLQFLILGRKLQQVENLFSECFQRCKTRCSYKLMAATDFIPTSCPNSREAEGPRMQTCSWEESSSRDFRRKLSHSAKPRRVKFHRPHQSQCLQPNRLTELRLSVSGFKLSSSGYERRKGCTLCSVVGFFENWSSRLTGLSKL